MISVHLLKHLQHFVAVGGIKNIPWNGRQNEEKKAYSDYVPLIFGASQVAHITLVLVFLPTEEQRLFIQ